MDYFVQRAEARLPVVLELFDKLPKGGHVNLYCSCYGGFGYSQHFETWTKSHKGVNMAALATAFGLKSAAASYCTFRLIFVPRYATCRFSEYDGNEIPCITFCDYSQYTLDLLLLARGEKAFDDLPDELKAIITSPLTPEECESLARADIEQAKPVMTQLYELTYNA